MIREHFTSSVTALAVGLAAASSAILAWPSAAVAAGNCWPVDGSGPRHLCGGFLIDEASTATFDSTAVAVIAMFAVVAALLVRRRGRGRV